MVDRTQQAVAEEQVRDLIRELYDAGDRQRMVDLLTDLYSQVSRENTRLQMQVLQLRERLYARKSEKVDPNQLRLALEGMRAQEFARQDAAAPEPGDEPAAEPSKPKKKKKKDAKNHPGRRPLPDHLPRLERRHTCSEEELHCECCSGTRHKFREEIVERLDYKPASFVVVQDIYEVYACACGQSAPVTASGPRRVIDGGLPEPGLLAKVTVSKYKDSLPLHRQVQIFKREGVELCANTLVGWIAAVAFLLMPLFRAINRRVLRSWVVQSDDTGLCVLDRRAAKGSKRGRIWANIGDGVWIVFHYSPNWKHEHPQRFLKGVCGYLQTDGYAGYKPLTRIPGVKASEDEVSDDTAIDDQARASEAAEDETSADEVGEADDDEAIPDTAIAVGCWMHARRKFHKAYKSGNPLAALPLDIIQRMYRVERESKKEGDTPEARFERRLRETEPLLNEFRAWLDDHMGRHSPSSLLGKAITYADNQWGTLCTFLLDGRLELDNGAVERALRGIAVGRKNWLFAGSDEGAERAAIIYTVIETAIRHGHNPHEYLVDVLDKLGAGWPQKRLDELLPDRWKPPERTVAATGPPSPRPAAEVMPQETPPRASEPASPATPPA